MFSEKFACPVSGFTIPEIEPRLFSFNNPFGACPECGGFGVEQHIDADLVIPDKERNAAQGRDRAVGEIVVALLCPDPGGAGNHLQVHARHQMERSAKKTQDAILYGSGDDAIRFIYDDGMRAYETNSRSRASSPISSAASAKPKATGRARRLAHYFTDVPCEACHGYRLKPEALCVKIAGRHIGEVSDLSVKRAGEWFTELPAASSTQSRTKSPAACSRKSASG